MTGPIYTPDGRQLILDSPAPEGWNTFATGRADNLNAQLPDSKNGTGPFIFLDVDGQSEKSMDFGFSQPVYLQNGQIYFVGSWSIEDYFSLSARIPATDFATGGTNDVVKYPIGGGASAWIPVGAGNGTHTFDTATAVPVWTTNAAIGKWDVNLSTDVVSPAPAGGQFMLIDFPIEAFFVKDVPVSPRKEFVTTLYKSQWISTKWSMHWHINKVSAGQGQASGWILTYRQDTT